MRKALIGLALAAATFLALQPSASVAQNAVDPSVIHHPTDFENSNVGLTPPAAAFETRHLVAAPDAAVVVPYGDWSVTLLDSVQAILLAAALWLLRKLPASAGAALSMLAALMGQRRVDTLLEKAIGYGINATEDAVRGKTLTVKVGNEVLERAFEYAIRHAPGLVEQLGGLSALREKIIARLDLEASAAVPTPRPAADMLVTKVDLPAPTPVIAAAAPAAT